MFKTNLFSLICDCVVLAAGVFVFVKGILAVNIGFIVAGTIAFLIGLFALIEYKKRRAKDYERNVTDRVMSSRH